MRIPHTAGGFAALLAAGLIAIAFAAHSGEIVRAAPAQDAAPDTQEGRQAYTQACVQCHGARHVVMQRKAEEGWRRTVYAMISRGAPLLAEEIEPLTAYLTATYGPNSPLPGSDLGPLPDEPGREVLMRSCTQCHAVEMVRASRKTEAEWLQTIELMVVNGAEIADDERPVLARFAASHFGAQ